MSSKAHMVIGWAMLISGIASLYYFGFVYDTAPLVDGSVRYVHNKAMIPQIDLSALCEPVAPLDLSALCEPVAPLDLSALYEPAAPLDLSVLWEPVAPLDLTGIGSCVKQDGIEIDKENL